MNSRIALSGLSILTALALIGGATFAFFSDTETSVGNTLAAGEIDLQVDNTCYYNGQACVDGFWGGNVGVGATDPANACSCNWALKDLTTEKFFSFQDLKPGDWEEDTISIHVNDNESWLCADVKLTSDDDVTCTEPELALGNDPTCTVPGAGTGELADALNFLWWADDGDNVLEVGETTLPSGPLGNLTVGQTATVDLADANSNIWGTIGDPFPAGSTRFIGKGFCFGALNTVPVAQDSLGATGTNGPDSIRGPGFTCDGTLENNETQTDSFTADISFRAVQSRNNGTFECEVPQ